MMKLTRFFRLFIYIFIFISLLGTLSACGNTAVPAVTTETTAQTTTATLTSPPQAVNALFGVPCYDTGRPLNPLTETSQFNRDVCALLFDPLFRLNNAWQAEANLCSAFSMTDNCLTLTIRSGVLFHDGTPLTAQDVLYSLKLAMTEEHSIYKDRFDGVTSISLDPQGRIVLTLDKARASLVSELNIPIIKQGTGYDRDAVGSGRYCMLETDGQRYLVPNTAHFSGRGNSVQMTHMQLAAVADADVLVYGVSSGNIDILRTADAKSADIVLHANADRYTVETTELFYLAFGNHNAIFDHLPVRRALGDLAAGAFDGQITDAPLLFHPALGYEFLTEADRAATADTLVSALLQAGYFRNDENRFCTVDGAQMTVRILTDSTDYCLTAAAAQIAAVLDTAGVSAELTSLCGDEYTAALQKKRFDLCLGCFDAGSDFDFSALLATGTAADLFGASGSDLDLLLDAYSQVGTAEGTLIARQLGERLAAEARVIPLGYRQDEVIVNRKFGIYNVVMMPDDIFYNIYDWMRAK